MGGMLIWERIEDNAGLRFTAYYSIWKITCFDGGNWVYQEIDWDPLATQHVQNRGWTINIETSQVAAVLDLKEQLYWLADHL